MSALSLWLISFSIIVIILLPLCLAIVLRRSDRVPWLYFCVGVLTFVVAQLVHLPLNRLLESAGLLPDEAVTGIALAQAAAILGLTAGLTEELVRTAGYAIVKRARRFQDGVMMGLGHGGIEAMLIAVVLAASISSLVFFSETNEPPVELLPEQAAAIEKQLSHLADSPLLTLAPLVERMIALAIQVSLSVVVLQAFVHRNWLYVAAAILIHATFDFVAVYASAEIENIWLLEAILALFALPLVVWTWRLRPGPEDREVARRTEFGQELNLFLVATKKECLYQWRSKRALIVWAVFLVIGMMSPLIAKFTPELLRNLEGAEQLAELIPEPSVADAVGQYVKNLTQFGFMLVILLGMGAIAGEKEKGTAAMILSKPMPRWAFVLGKYIAQSIVYLIGFLLASVAAYYYTQFLFDGLVLSGFSAASALLLLWILVFASVTLLGSAIGRTTAIAAGIGLLGSVLLLIAGAIPRFGALAPAGLISWAGQLAIEESGPSNAGALVMSAVVILMMLVSAVAVFEREEL
jgi:ABC-2 type transport system permease protein